VMFRWLCLACQRIAEQRCQVVTGLYSGNAGEGGEYQAGSARGHWLGPKRTISLRE